MSTAGKINQEIIANLETAREITQAELWDINKAMEANGPRQNLRTELADAEQKLSEINAQIRERSDRVVESVESPDDETSGYDTEMTF